MNQSAEVPIRQRIERPPPQHSQRENRPWQQRPRDFPDRRNQQQQQAPPLRPIAPPIVPPREAAAPPPRPDIDTLTREIEKLRIQIAELQKPSPAANFTQFTEQQIAPPVPEQDIVPPLQPLDSELIKMYDGFTDPFWPSYATKRPAETQPEAEQPPLRRRPNNLEHTTVDPRNPPRPAAPRPLPQQ